MLEQLIKDKDVFIFDFDGTLIDSLWVWNKADVLLIRDLIGLEVDPNVIGYDRDQILANTKTDNPYMEYVEFLIDRYNLEEDSKLVYAIRKEICKELINRITLKPYAEELLSYLKELNFRVCLATTGHKSSVDRILHEVKGTKFLDTYPFDMVCTDEGVTNLKPDPEVHLKIQQSLEFDKKNALIVEDSLVGLQAAINSGIDYVIVKEELNSHQDEIKKLAKTYINSLEDIYKTLKKMY